MLRAFPGIIAVAIALSLASTAMAATRHKPPHKHRYTNHSVPGYGFLPGVRTPAQIERARMAAWRRDHAFYSRHGYPRVSYYRWSSPGFYRGRWNGGSMGPCWTLTPIGYQWNCGR